MNLRGKAILTAIRRRQAERLRLKRAGRFDRLGSGRGLAVPLGKDALALADPGGNVQSVDRKLFAATFVITTKAEDRDGDVVEPKGCLRTLPDGFSRNPRVFWDHQLDPVPIGSARGKDGKLLLTVGEDQILSTVRFHGKTQRSTEIGTLVMDGELVACSIGFAPIEAERRPERQKDAAGNRPQRGPGWHFLEWELLEWSVCGIGANREALRLSLDRGRVKDAGLRRELEPFAARLRGTVNGHTFEKAPMRFRVKDLHSVLFPKAQFKDLDSCLAWLKAHKFGKAIVATQSDTGLLWQPAANAEPGDRHEHKGATLTLAKGKKALGDGEEDEEELDLDADEEEETESEEEQDEEGDDAVPLGAQVMRDLMAHYDACLAYCRSMLPKLEPDSAVKAFVAEHSEELESCLAEYRALAEQTYPDVDFDTKDDVPAEEEDDEVPEEEEDEAGAEETQEEQEEDEHEYRGGKTPKTKGLSKRCKGVIQEASEYLRDVADDDTLPKRLKGGHKYHAAELGKLTEDGSRVPVEEDEDAEEDEGKGKKAGKKKQAPASKLDAKAILAALKATEARQKKLAKKMYALTGKRA